MPIVNLDTSWSGYAGPFVIPAVASDPTFSNGLLYMKSGVRKKYTVPRLKKSTAGLRPRQVDPVDDGLNPITIDNKVLYPKAFQAFTTFAAIDLEEHFQVENLANKIATREIPEELKAKIMMYYSKLIAAKIGQMIWVGSTSYASKPIDDAKYELQFIDGIIKQMIADAGVYKTSGAATLTNSNIGTALNDLLLTATINTPALVTDPEYRSQMIYIMSPKTRYLYNDYLVNITYKSLDPRSGEAPAWKQFPTITLPYFPDDTILFTNAAAAETGNLWFAMNSGEDMTFEYGRVQNFSERYGLLIKAKIDTTYALESQAFLYTTLTAASFL